MAERSGFLSDEHEDHGSLQLFSRRESLNSPSSQFQEVVRSSVNIGLHVTP